MYTYKRSSDVDLELTYRGFIKGFSDYMIKIDVSKDGFVKRFLGPEGNRLENSFVALYNNKPIGIILGGIRQFSGLKTMRCGGLCVVKDHRGKGISDKLLKLHKEDAIKNNCKQLFLEVISNNDRAIKFYNKYGYEKIYDLNYFGLKDTKEIKKNPLKSLKLREISIEELKKLRKDIFDVHINWQNEMEYIEESHNQHNYGVFEEKKLIGAISINSSSYQLNFIWVKEDKRYKKIGTTLLSHGLSELNLKGISTGFPNNSSLEGFLKKLDFKRSPLSQYEMYLLL